MSQLRENKEKMVTTNLSFASLPSYFHTLVKNFAQCVSPLYALSKEYNILEDLAKDADQKPMVMVMGEFSAGKSTFINALLGKQLLKVDITPSTAAVTLLSYGDEPKVVAHYRNKSTWVLPMESLQEISSEGSTQGKEIRENLSFLEVFLPNPILKKYTIIDTPGLNSGNELHTQATEFFMERADIALWLFHYLSVGTKTEIASLHTMKKYLQPIGVINGIDYHDEEEEPLSLFLSDMEKRVGNLVASLIPVSALNALEGTMEGNHLKIQESKWSQVLNELEKHCSGDIAIKNQLTRKFSRLESILVSILNSVVQFRNQYDKAYSMINSYEQYLLQTKNQIGKLKSEGEFWLEMSRNGDIKDIIKHPISEILYLATGLRSQQEIVSGSYEELEKERSRLMQKKRWLEQEPNILKSRQQQITAELNQYNRSGIFGGRPLLDWSGNLKRIGEDQEQIKNDIRSFEEEEERHERAMEQFQHRLSLVRFEAREFADRVVENTMVTLKDMIEKYNDPSQQMKATDSLHELRWLSELRNVFSHVVTPALKAIVQAFNESQHKDKWFKKLQSCFENVNSIMDQLDGLNFDVEIKYEKIKAETNSKLSNYSRIRNTKSKRFWLNTIFSICLIFVVYFNKIWVLNQANGLYHFAETTLSKIGAFHSNNETTTTSSNVLKAKPATKILQALVTANIRNEPSLNGKKVGLVDRNETFMFLNKEEKDTEGRNWYYIKTNTGILGWISSSLTKWK